MNDLMAAPDSPPETPEVPAGALILRAEAMDRGVNADDIKRRLERGHWIALRPGAYLRASTERELTPVQRHVLQVDATMAAGGEGMVVSHRSAAWLHGLDLLRAPGRAVEVTKPGATAGRRTAVRHTYCSPVDSDEIVVLRGHRVTTPARTVIDLARTRSFEEALVATDSALYLGRATRDELRCAADRAAGRRGIRAAQQVIAFADGRAESPGESRSRLLVAHQLLPTPELQLPIRNPSGVAIAHCDFGWREYRTVGEFDGAEKYGRGLRPGEGVGDRILEEKVREDRIRDLGWTVVRWTWPDLEDPIMVANRIRRALARGGAISG